jgi:hypothetical protein
MVWLQWAATEVAERGSIPAEDISAEVSRRITEGSGAVDYVEVGCPTLFPRGGPARTLQFLQRISHTWLGQMSIT